MLASGTEILLALSVIGSVAAVGSVHPWAYRPLWIAAGLAVLLLLARAAAVRALRRLLGRVRFAFHPSGRWIVLAPSERSPQGWSFDLGAPLFERGPLLLPGLCFIGWVLLQLVPGPGGRPISISPNDTGRGLAFVLASLALHQVAKASLNGRRARTRFFRVVAGLGLALAGVAFLQTAAGTTLIYGVFAPVEGGRPFGPFVNRNHFAGYLLMVVPVALALLQRTLRRYGARVGARPNWRRRLVALQTRESTALLYSALPPLAATAALVATTSRGALVAFVAALALGALGLRRRDVPAWALAVACLGVTLSWFGLERLEQRVQRVGEDAPGRTLVWRDALSRMDGLWLFGSGFNTFGLQMSRTAAWALPTGATPWPEEMRATLESGVRVGYRAVAELPGRRWYREAHNDYLQLLVEAGIPGLVIALWGAVAVLAAARSSPWLLSGLAGVLLHEIVDFDLQIPGTAVLFCVLAALAPVRGVDSRGVERTRG